MELKERNCHRLKAVLREVSVKCIRESIWRTRAANRITHVTCTKVEDVFVHECPL